MNANQPVDVGTERAMLRIFNCILFAIAIANLAILIACAPPTNQEPVAPDPDGLLIVCPGSGG